MNNISINYFFSFRISPIIFFHRLLKEPKWSTCFYHTEENFLEDNTRLSFSFFSPRKVQVKKAIQITGEIVFFQIEEDSLLFSINK